jgi:hypothetical protein
MSIVLNNIYKNTAWYMLPSSRELKRQAPSTFQNIANNVYGYNQSLGNSNQPPSNDMNYAMAGWVG